MDETERLSLELENAHREIYRLKNELQWAQTVAIDYRRQVVEYRRIYEKEAERIKKMEPAEKAAEQFKKCVIECECP